MILEARRNNKSVKGISTTSFFRAERLLKVLQNTTMLEAIVPSHLRCFKPFLPARAGRPQAQHPDPPPRPHRHPESPGEPLNFSTPHSPPAAGKGHRNTLRGTGIPHYFTNRYLAGAEGKLRESGGAAPSFRGSLLVAPQEFYEGLGPSQRLTRRGWPGHINQYRVWQKARKLSCNQIYYQRSPCLDTSV